MALDQEREAARVAEVFAALSHPRRVVILECLLERERSVGDLVRCERLEPSTQSNTSQQLAVLRRAGLVKERRDGNRVIYSAASPKLKELVKVASVLTHERVKALL